MQRRAIVTEDDRFVVVEDFDDMVWLVIDTHSKELMAKCPTKRAAETLQSAMAALRD